MTDASIRYQWGDFDSLSNRQLYQLLQLRAEVFVVEQRCVYLDPDGLDQQAWHLLAWDKESDRLSGYLRVLPPGVKYPEVSIGRVCTAENSRGTGAGRHMMTEVLARIGRQYPGQAIRISAQCYLQNFYESFGFAVSSAAYEEDGIPHIEMHYQPV